eukprot:scaffold223970_cov39-Tisochrysis_lutea.AAC.1
MEAKGFTCNSPPADDGVDPCASPPARASAASVASSDISVDSHTPASEPPPDTGTPLGSPLSTAPNSTGFKINLAAVKREQVDSTKPLAVPHTPKAEVRATQSPLTLCPPVASRPLLRTPLGCRAARQAAGRDGWEECNLQRRRHQRHAITGCRRRSCRLP